MKPKAFEIVVRTVQPSDFDLAAVTRTRIHLPDVERPAINPPYILAESASELFDFVVRERNSRFGHDGASENLPQQQLHPRRRRPSALISSSMLRTPVR